MSKYIGTSKAQFEIMQKSGVIIPPYFVSDSIDHAILFAHGACNNQQAPEEVLDLQKKVRNLQRRALLKLMYRKFTRSVLGLDPFYGAGSLLRADAEDKFIDSTHITYKFTPFDLSYLNEFSDLNLPLVIEISTFDSMLNDRPSLDDFFGKFISEDSCFSEANNTEHGLLLTESINSVTEITNSTLCSDFLRRIQHNNQEGAQRFWDKLIS